MTAPAGEATRLGRAADLVKIAAVDWWDDKCPRLAGALAFYTLLSLAPLLILAVALAGLVVGEDRARQELVQAFDGLIGGHADDVVTTVTGRSAERGSSIVATLTGGAVLLFGASGVFGELQEALNDIWEVEPKPGRGVLGVVRDRLFSVGLVLAVALLLLVSLVATAALTAVGEVLSSRLPGGQVLWRVVDVGAGVVAAAAIFATIFKVLPDAEVRWKDVWLGAGVTAVLFTLGRVLIGLYLGHSSVSANYGAAGSVVAIVIWAYFSGLIVLFGAELTQVYAARYGSRITPTAKAVVKETAKDDPDVAVAQRPKSSRPASPLEPALRNTLPSA